MCSILKRIHYFNFSKEHMTKEEKKNLKLIKKSCPDWEICVWDENSIDFSNIKYAEDAIDVGDFKALMDIARLKIIYENGGVFVNLGTISKDDIKRIKDRAALGKAFFYLEDKDEVKVALDYVFGAEFGSKVLLHWLAGFQSFGYNDIEFSDDWNIWGYGFSKELKEQSNRGIYLFVRE